MANFFSLLPKPKQPTREASSNQDSSYEIVRELQQLKILDGALLGPFSLSGGTPKQVRHTLKRQPKGWWVVDQQHQNVVFRTSWDSDSITLDASGPIAGVTIWLF